MVSALLLHLVDAALLAASLGPTGALVLAGVGLVFLVLGHRAFRPSAALVFAGAATLAVHLLVTRWHVETPGSKMFVSAVAAVVGAAFGLMLPRLAVALAGSIFGLAVGFFIHSQWQDAKDLVLLGASAGGAFAALAFWSSLPQLVSPLVASAFVTFGAWGWVGASGESPKLFRLPAAWVAVFGVVAVIGLGVEQARAGRRAAKSTRKQGEADADAKKRKDAELRERYARYYE